MSEASGKIFIGFGDLFQALSSKKVIRTKNGNLNISGNIVSSKDFNELYMHDINSMLSEYETTISPEFAPSKDLYQTLDVLSSPVLKGTKVPEAIKGFYKKLNTALSSKEENRQVFEAGVLEYVNDSEDTPVFMLVSMDKEIGTKDNTPSPFKSLLPDSTTLMDGYGTKYNGKDILDLAEKGYIEPQAPINMLVYKSLYVQDEKSDDYIEPVSYDELLAFYSPEKNPGRIHSLLVNGKIDKNFSDLHSELLDNISKKDRKNYIEDLIDETKKLASTPIDYTTDLLGYANTHIIPDSSLSGNITAELLKAKFLAGEISIARILEIYETDPKYFKAVETILTPNQIEKAHSNDEVEDKALMYLPENSRASYLQKSKAKLSTIMYLFLHFDGVSITELQKMLLQNNNLESLDFYIDVGSHPSRIKELYENYLIDYGCIKNLIANGILKETDMQKYKLGISKEKIYDDIEDAKSVEITGSANSVPFSTTGSFIGINSTTKDTVTKSTNLYRVLGNISEQDSINLPTISHKDKRDNPSFLDGYKILPLKPSNLVAFLPPEPTKSTFLMPYQETAYILHNRALPASLPENPVFQEIKASEKMHEEILRTAYQFEESKSYLDKLGYSEDLNFEEAMKIMTEQYMKIRTKGEN